jgi:hypothetical protein
MPSKIVRIYEGEGETVIGWNSGAYAADARGFSEFMEDRGYKHGQTPPMVGSLSLHHTVVQPEMSDRDIRDFANLCVGVDRGIRLDGSSTMEREFNGVVVLDSRQGRPGVIAQG